MLAKDASSHATLNKTKTARSAKTLRSKIKTPRNSNLFIAVHMSSRFGMSLWYL